MNRIILFFFSCFALTSCCVFSRFNKENRKQNPATYHIKWIPPGIVKLANGSMIDETEITNFNWMEYVYWTRRVFGIDSAKQMNILPDSNVWKQFNYCYSPFDTYYLTHPAFRNYPVVGITQEQATKFCEWRSNRVMEYILIRDGFLEWDPWQTAEEHFTIEEYFKGNYFGCIPDTNYNYVPRYKLMSIIEWSYAVEQNDSLECERLGKSKDKMKRSCWENPLIHSGVLPCDTAYRKSVTAPINSKCFKKSLPNYIYHLRGNVREWVLEKDTCIGGGWNDSKKTIFLQPIINQTKQSSNTGFRCACIWEKVPKKK